MQHLRPASVAVVHTAADRALTSSCLHRFTAFSAQCCLRNVEHVKAAQHGANNVTHCCSVALPDSRHHLYGTHLSDACLPHDLDAFACTGVFLHGAAAVL